MVQAEKDVLPARAVPQTVAQPNGEQSDRARQQRPEVAAQPPARGAGQLFERAGHGEGIEDIILKPCAERDMPAHPELLNARREEGLAEVFRQPDAEDLCAADDDVHRAREFHVQLAGVAHHRKGGDAAVIGGGIGKDALDQDVQPVGDDDLFHHAEQDALHAEGQVFPCERAALPQRQGGLPIAANRALHDLREKAEEQHEPAEVAVRADRAAVYVDQVGYRLQRIERNADGQQECRDGQRKRQTKCVQQAV